MPIKKTFEHQEIGRVSRCTLEPYLITVWEQKFALISEEEDDVSESTRLKKQGIASFDHNTAYARNYIGIIQTEEDQIEIYPKVFRNYENNNLQHTQLFIGHIFYWFGYCRRWKFPVSKNSLDQHAEYDLLELIIYLMANRVHEVISETPISLYEAQEESLTMPRDSINFTRYTTNCLTKGNYHIIECDTEPLQYDNQLNRVIKYVARLLYNKAKLSKTQQKLEDTLFILDEVADIVCTSSLLNSIKINSYYSAYHEVMDICRLVLDQQLYSNEAREQTQWCFLFPMEYIFEDFIAGFLETHFSGQWKVESQKSNESLTDQGVFRMKHDIFLTSRKQPHRKIIIDTKYKLRSLDQRSKNNKKGIAQSDLYQMTSYAFRRGCNIVLLLYPNYSEQLQPDDYFTISSRYAGKEKIHVIAAEVPFWGMKNFHSLHQQMIQKMNELLTYIHTIPVDQMTVEHYELPADSGSRHNQ